jgi:hypothetical protein
MFAAVVMTCCLMAVGSSAEAARTLNCGTYGSVKYGIVGGSGTYTTKAMFSPTKTNPLEADIKWAPPVAGATASWYYGFVSVSGVAYSPAMSNTNYPTSMRAIVGEPVNWNPVCTGLQTASAY